VEIVRLFSNSEYCVANCEACGSAPRAQRNFVLFLVGVHERLGRKCCHNNSHKQYQDRYAGMSGRIISSARSLLY
jgi:hypothetical protein